MCARALWCGAGELNPFGPKPPFANFFFSPKNIFLGSLFSRKFSFKPWEVQTFHFLENVFEGPPHRRFEGYEVAAKKSRSFGKSDFLVDFENFFLDFEDLFFQFFVFSCFSSHEVSKVVRFYI